MFIFVVINWWIDLLLCHWFHSLIPEVFFFNFQFTVVFMFECLFKVFNCLLICFLNLNFKCTPRLLQIHMSPHMPAILINIETLIWVIATASSGFKIQIKYSTFFIIKALKYFFFYLLWLICIVWDANNKKIVQLKRHAFCLDIFLKLFEKMLSRSRNGGLLPGDCSALFSCRLPFNRLLLFSRISIHHTRRLTKAEHMNV